MPAPFANQSQPVTVLHYFYHWEQPIALVVLSDTGWLADNWLGSLLILWPLLRFSMNK